MLASRSRELNIAWWHFQLLLSCSTMPLSMVVVVRLWKYRCVFDIRRLKTGSATPTPGFVWLSLLSNAPISSTADQPLGPLWTAMALVYISGAARHFPGPDSKLCSHLLELEANTVFQWESCCGSQFGRLFVVVCLKSTTKKLQQIHLSIWKWKSALLVWK